MMKNAALALLSACVVGPHLFANVSVELNAPASSIELGETLTFTASARDATNSQAHFTYQFTVRFGGSGPFTVVKDFYYVNTFSWTPGSYEGAYDIGVTAKSSTGASSAVAERVYVTSRVISGRPVVSNTRNSLVALYSAPPCAAPAQLRIHFGPQGQLNNHEQFTPFKPCNGLSVNFYIGGLRENTTYIMQQQATNGASGPLLAWRSGGLPAGARIPSHTTLHGPTVPTSVNYPFLLRSVLYSLPFATDMDENVVWYAGWDQPNDTGYLVNIVSGGYFLAIQDDPENSLRICPSGTVGRCGDHQYFREYDLAGNTIRETNFTVVQSEINNIRAAQHKTPVVLNQFSHEGIGLPGGNSATMVTDEQIRNQGAGLVDVLGDTIVVLNSNLQVVWQWDTFDFFNITRVSRVLPATCIGGGPGCPGKFYNINPSTHQPYTVANDWTHANSIYYDPSDGNLVISFRNQSWVVKVAYQNGSGDGHIVWILGFGGTFALAPGYPVTDWFSGQHDARFQANGLFTLFDDNNPSPPSNQPGGDSRGQAWRLDTGNHVATPVVNFDLDSSSLALGSATLLSNGNYEFNSGYIGNSYAQTSEFTPSGALVYKEQTDVGTYRSFRLRDFYTP